MRLIIITILACCVSGCAANRDDIRSYVASQCQKEGYTIGTPEYDGCLKVKDRQTYRGIAVAP